MHTHREDIELARAAARLARLHPEWWSKFLTEFQNYTTRGALRLPGLSERIEFNQGRILERQKVLELLAECIVTANAAENKK